MQNNFEQLTKRIKLYEPKFEPIELKASNDLESHYNLLSVTTFDNLKRLIHLLQLFKNNEIINACKNHFIPTTILPPSISNIDLVNLESEIKKIDHTLVIPLDELSRYYKIAIKQNNCTC